MTALSVFDIAGRAMSAQLVRLNTVASNLANAGSIAGSEAGAYRPLKPVFATEYKGSLATVDVERIASGSAPERRHEPGHPLADAQGDVWVARVDTNQELVEMTETARQYANNVEVMATAKSLILDTLRMGK